MFSFPRGARSVARIAVGLVALGVPLLGASVAQGAIGTANQVTTNNPDIRTATILPLTNQVEICFDGPIDLAAGNGVGDVTVGGYISSAVAGANTAVIQSTNCIKAQFPGTVDLQSTTYGHIAAGTVKNLTNANTNLNDAAPLIGSTSKSGTRGNSTSPDLIAVVPDEQQNQMLYVFDQEIQDTADACAGPFPDPNANFRFYDSQGIEHGGGAVIACDNDSDLGGVLVQFTAPADNVAQAERAFVLDGQVRSTPPNATLNRLFSVVVPGHTGRSNDPDLLSAELQNPAGTSNQMDFAYDEDIANINPASFYHAILSDGSICTGNNGVPVALVNARTARVTMTCPGVGAAELVTEFIIGGYSDQNAVQGSDDNAPSPSNGLPSGGNAGANALGYTTGPDPLQSSVDQTQGQITLRVDQRVVQAPNPVVLVNTAGLTGVTCSATSIGTLGAPGQQNVIYQCPQSDLADAVGIYLSGPPFGPVSLFSTLGYPNADQIVGIR